MNGTTSASTPTHFLHPRPKHRFNKNRFIGRWRLFWGNCPACNSDAPAMYDCSVCDFKDNYHERGRRVDKKYWWNRFLLFIKK